MSNAFVFLPDGLYRVDRFAVCGGFVIANHRVVQCAPILRRTLGYWLRFAERIGP